MSLIAASARPGTCPAAALRGRATGSRASDHRTRVYAAHRQRSHPDSQRGQVLGGQQDRQRLSQRVFVVGKPLGEGREALNVAASQRFSGPTPQHGAQFRLGMEGQPVIETPQGRVSIADQMRPLAI